MNIDELVYDLKEHLDTYCQTYDDYDMTYNQTEMIYYLIKNLEQENKKYKEVINKAIEYLESKRVREKAIIDVDVLQGILKEVEHE